MGGRRDLWGDGGQAQPMAAMGGTGVTYVKMGGRHDLQKGLGGQE